MTWNRGKPQRTVRGEPSVSIACKAGPGVEHLVPMRPHRNFGRAGRAAGAEVGGYVVGAYRARRDQTVRWLLAHRFPQVDDLDADGRLSLVNRGARDLPLFGVEVVGHVDERDRLEVGKRAKLRGQNPATPSVAKPAPA